MAVTSAGALEDMATDYAAYVNLDMHGELKDVYESVEEMQLRLEEFISIMGMLKDKGDKSITGNVPKFLALKPKLNELGKRIDALDSFIAKANSDLTTLEARMEATELALGASDNKMIKLNPFSFFKKSPESINQPQPEVFHESSDTFKMEDYFKNNSSK